ncbi:unnamed protein product, partial [Meganyctiphanes norvegica]
MLMHYSLLPNVPLSGDVSGRQAMVEYLPFDVRTSSMVSAGKFNKMDDDLEYYITFPTPTPKTEPNGSADPPEDDDDYVFVNGDQGEKEPVVFLLGWLGAQDRYLAKYSNIYSQRGCITIRYTTPPSYVFQIRNSNKFLPIARKLLGLLKDMSLDEHPVFFHMFSNNGSTLYYYLSQAMCEPDAPKVLLRGCMFDSTPAPKRIWSGCNAIYEITRGSVWMRMFASLAMFLYLMSLGAVSIFWSILTGKLPSYPPWTLVEEKSRVPQLFLYSKSDKVIAVDDVENFACERRKLGVQVVAQCWPDSQHCQHYRQYPEAYSQSVYSFVSMCLSQE